MTFAHSKLVPVAFWIAFVALGLVTSLGSPQKSQVQRHKTVNNPFVLPSEHGEAEIALRGYSTRGPREGMSQLRSVQTD